MADGDTDHEASIPGIDLTERQLRLHLVEQAMRNLPPDNDLETFAGQALNFVMSQSDRESG